MTTCVQLPIVTTAGELGKKLHTDAVHQAALSELGITKGDRCKVEKQPWLWTDEAKVQEELALSCVSQRKDSR